MVTIKLANMKIIVCLIICFQMVHGLDSFNIFNDMFLNLTNSIILNELWQVLETLTNFKPNEVCKNIEKSRASPECNRQLRAVCENASLIITMIDASSKGIPSGSIKEESSRFDYGNFDQCLSIDHTSENTRVLGKYCAGGLVIPTTTLTDPNFFQKAFKLSVCIPDKCSAKDFQRIFNVTENQSMLNDIACNTKQSYIHLGPLGIFTMTIFGIITVIMIVSTIYDIYLKLMNLDSRYPLLLVFSLLSNGKNLLKTRDRNVYSDQIMVFHGIRVISLMWIIAGHTFATYSFIPALNDKSGLAFQWQTKSFYITSAIFAVDTFFFMSGFLMAYQYLKEKEQPFKVHMKRVPFLYLHRYLRITPALAVAYLFFTFILDKIGSGPLYQEMMKPLTQACRDHSWPFFLYVQNYVNYDDLCLVPSWYLSADMQLFLLAPLILIPITRQVKQHFNLVMLELVFLNTLCIILPFGLKIIFEDFKNEYDVHSRLHDYFIGFMLGVFMRVKKDNKFFFKKEANIIIWIVTLFTMISVVLCGKEIQLLIYNGSKSSIVYMIFLRGLWCIGLSWIVYSCHNNSGGVIGWFLTRPLFQILSKLTYCMYLTHPFPTLYQAFSMKTINYFREYDMFYFWCGNYVLTIAIATYWTFAFESPLILVEKYVFSKQTRSIGGIKPVVNVMLTLAPVNLIVVAIFCTVSTDKPLQTQTTIMEVAIIETNRDVTPKKTDRYIKQNYE